MTCVFISSESQDVLGTNLEDDHARRLEDLEKYPASYEKRVLESRPRWTPGEMMMQRLKAIMERRKQLMRELGQQMAEREPPTTPATPQSPISSMLPQVKKMIMITRTLRPIHPSFVPMNTNTQQQQVPQIPAKQPTEEAVPKQAPERKNNIVITHRQDNIMHRLAASFRPSNTHGLIVTHQENLIHMPGINVPQARLNILQQRLNIPEQRLNIPEQRMSIPQLRMDEAQSRLNILQHRLNMPEQRLNMPQMRMDEPQTRLNILQQRLNIPQLRMDEPQTRLNILQQRLNIPDQRLNLPQLRLNLPQQPRLSLPQPRPNPDFPQIPRATPAPPVERRLSQQTSIFSNPDFAQQQLSNREQLQRRLIPDMHFRHMQQPDFHHPFPGVYLPHFPIEMPPVIVEPGPNFIGLFWNNHVSLHCCGGKMTHYVPLWHAP